MSDERDTADFIKSLFRVSGLEEPDLEEGQDWIDYSSGKKIAPIYTVEPSAGDVPFFGNEDDDRQKDAAEEGRDEDLSQAYYSCDEDFFTLPDGEADSKEVEEKKATFQSWCIIA